MPRAYARAWVVGYEYRRALWHKAHAFVCRYNAARSLPHEGA